MRLLLVDDDQELVRSLTILLSKNGYAVDTADSIRCAFGKIADEPYDLVIIDRTLPDGDGLTLIPVIRNEHAMIPILILTSLSQSSDEIKGLDTGADDYLGKPFAIEVLLARIRSMLRRKEVPVVHPVITVGDLRIDTNVREVRKNGNRIALSPREYAVLEFLARSPDTAVDRMDILSHAWDENADPFSNTVDVHIKNIRKKLDARNSSRYIRTVKGLGYMLCGKNP